MPHAPIVAKRRAGGTAPEPPKHWQNDPEGCEVVFASCVDNWKEYPDHDRANHKVKLKIYASYSQATRGDNPAWAR